MLESTTIRPGVLVSLKTQLKGGVSYKTTEETVEREGVAEHKSWRTDRHVEDVRELKAATEVRNKAGNMIRNACIRTPFGLLCPLSEKDQLIRRIREARAVTEEHNKDARFTRVDVYVLMGDIASNDREAAKALLSDVRSTIEQMQGGITEVDVQKIREAAKRAKELGRMLTDQQSSIVGGAVKAAREAARLLLKRVENGSETAEAVLKEVNLGPINNVRFLHLDIDDEVVENPTIQVEEAALIKDSPVVKTSKKAKKTKKVTN